MLRIAIIGGGFSGAMALAQLVRQAQAPMEILLCDSTGRFAQGVAYSTRRPEHLLNVPAGRMGAFPEAPDGFYRWLDSAEGRAARARWNITSAFGPDDFAPRCLYGEYMQQVLQEALKEAIGRNLAVRLHAAEITRADWNAQARQFHLPIPGEEEFHADALVLACGTLSAAGQHRLPAWEWFARADNARDRELAAARHIVLVGSGLTMVDAAITLNRLGFGGTLTAASRHGLLPAAHAPAPLPPQSAAPFTLQPALAPRTARGLLQALRKAADAEWRPGIDALRPVTDTLWRQLPVAEQKRALRHLFTLWNVHRHRMAPQIHAELAAMCARGTLINRKGRISDVTQTDEGFRATLTHRGKIETLVADAVIDCTGPAYDIRKSRHGLLQQLLAQGIITPSPAGPGIAVTPGLSARGPAGKHLFAMGALLLGERFECTAVPPVREQAQGVAAEIVALQGLQQSHMAMKKQ